MKFKFCMLAISYFFLSFTSNVTDTKIRWTSIFDGVSLNGWKVGANASTFKVENKMIVVNGNVAHLFYTGPVGEHVFKNFELKADVMTMPGSNSGIYFHTAYQESSWPEKGYEVQVNNSHTDWRRTGSLYGIQDLKEKFAKDSVWFNLHIIVKDKTVKVWVDKKLVNTFTESATVKKENAKQRLIANGTIALQGHDPMSKVFYKNIKLKILPD